MQPNDYHERSPHHGVPGHEPAFDSSPGPRTVPPIGDDILDLSPAASSLQSPAYGLQRPPYRRRIALPIVLLLTTLFSTFWAGAVGGIPWPLEFAWIALQRNWLDGLLYMGAVMAILVAHEMGHFIMAVRYRVPASLPYFIPMPLTPIGTMGAVIGMRGSQADRRELFDIGLAGPLAGLLVALPIMCYGVLVAEPVRVVPGQQLIFNEPLIFDLLLGYLRPELLDAPEIATNPLYFAGWVGMLITGLNMLPISQLDGGHVAYALFGRKSHWLARGVVVAAAAFILLAQQYNWTVMLMLVMFIGTDHPPTANDAAPLGWKRRLLGLLSLSIPILCLTPIPVELSG